MKTITDLDAKAFPNFLVMRKASQRKSKPIEKLFSSQNQPVITFGLLEDFSEDFINKPPELDDTDDDSTVSSYSASTTTSKGVSFATSIVTEVHYRPRTSKKDKSSLYYSVQETAR